MLPPARLSSDSKTQMERSLSQLPEHASCVISERIWAIGGGAPMGRDFLWLIRLP